MAVKQIGVISDPIADILTLIRNANGARPPEVRVPSSRLKLELARVLATRPRMILLDEVMGGLNARESEEIIGLILDVKKRGLTQVVIEHDMKAIVRTCDRIVVLNSGEKLAEGSPQQVVNDPRVMAAYLGDSGGAKA